MKINFTPCTFAFALGRQNLEQIYKQVSGNTWSASIDARSLDQLQKMRCCTSAFSVSDEDKLRVSSADKPISRSPSSLHSTQSARSPRRAQSMPPRTRKQAAGASKPKPVSRPSTNVTITNSSDKVWIKPEAINSAPIVTDLDSFATTVGQSGASDDHQFDLPKPIQPTNQAPSTGFSSPPAIHGGPVRITDIKSPEELSGIKSPPPENWLISVDQKPIDWTNSNQTSRTAINSSSADMYDNLLDTFGSASPSAPNSSNYNAAEPSLMSGL
jgi:hypothetical protein